MSEEKEEDFPLEVPRKTDEELRKFVDDYVSGRVFTTLQIRDTHLFGMVFIVLGFGALEPYPESYKQSIGLVYEYYEKALSRGVNGMPMFMSCLLLHKKDWEIALPSINAEHARRGVIPLIKAEPTI